MFPSTSEPISTRFPPNPPPPPVAPVKRAATDLLGELRSLLNQHAGVADLTLAARRLGTSPRSLQRALNGLGTSFRTELAAVRIERARERLIHGNAALTVIALELGYASLQSFDRQFRRLMGETPGGFRRRARCATP